VGISASRVRRAKGRSPPTLKRRACVIAAAAYFAARVALGQDAGGSHQTGETAEPRLTASQNPTLGRAPPQGNPLWRIPMNSLSATRERPLFSASRRPPAVPPAQPPTSIAKPSPAPEPERPPLSLQGTAIGKPRDIALILDEATKGSVRLRVGEAAEGWRLRSVDRREVTIEKDSRILVLSLPSPGAAPPSPAGLATAQSEQPSRHYDGRPRAKTRWISIAHVVY
jgi:general secretion pathway protein N